MGILLALGAAFLESIKDAINKKNLKNIDPYIMSWAFRTLGFLLIVPVLLFIDIPKLDSVFWGVLVISGILNSITTILYMKALQTSDLSDSVPLIALTPCFLLITSPLMIGEIPTFSGGIGVILGVIGAYFLAFKKNQKNFLSPFIHLYRDTGSRLMIGIAFIFSITSNLDKIGILHSSPLFWLVSMNFFLMISLFPIMLTFSDKSYKKTLTQWKGLLIAGIIGIIALVCHIQALSITLVSYVISVKRMSAVFSVIIGYLVFNEKNIGTRLIGSILMVIGVVCIMLA